LTEAASGRSALSTADFDFALPAERIAQHPVSPRQSARLLHVAGGLSDHYVADLPDLLRPGDLLVANDTRVIPAQLSARRGEAHIGITLDRPLDDGSWHALARNARRLHPGDRLDFDGAPDFHAEVAALEGEGSVRLRFDRAGEDFAEALRRAGSLALPPYIDRPHGPTEADARDYQTVFAARDGAVAAPTAGLHFSPALLDRLAARGIGRVTLTLHVGAGTFLPVRSETLDGHRMHPERGSLTAEVAAAINQARRQGGRIVAVGTTSLRLLETACGEDGTISPFEGETGIFIRPGMTVRGADLLLTNFHLPRSTLFMLVCAFAGTDVMKRAYAHAIASGYRFYSYGDASLLTRSDLQ
jgi:S-adenosylmethionine:tRNA ribosyltransferase-isomerase